MFRVMDSEEESQKVIPFVLKSETSAIGPFIKWASKKIAPYLPEGNKPEIIDEFTLALSEVITNQAEHAYRYKTDMIVGRLTLTNQRWQADSFDRGIGFDTDTAEEFEINPDDPPIHGYGLRIMHSLLDHCLYQRYEDGRNHWTLVKIISGDEME